MTKRMLIDATHKEETRVAITDGNKLIEYDYESQTRKPLKGSIFLAKVTRVEPSLQAAFVNFGGNRHGFLPFSEIHPDYFRIPVADREALIAEQEALLQQHDEEESELEAQDSAEEDEADSVSEDLSEEISEPEEGDGSVEDFDNEAQDEASDSDDEGETGESDDDSDQDDDLGAGEAEDEQDRQGEEGEGKSDNDGRPKRGRGRGRGRRGRGRMANRNRNVEVVGGEEVDEEQRFRFNLRRKYKIQEVIKRGQIMLVQVNKEERGNKGAAVGSYLSLPGRYCVLMPNSPRAGGVSRKIANNKDRARMREIVKDLEVPKGMSVIVRTAGVTRTKTEIKRDLDYLMRLWDNIRSLTLESTAPSMVYEEADLIKRAVRDHYTRDVEDILVAGEKGYETAKNFMKMMIPSHVKKVKQYKGQQLPLFNRYQIESQIDEIGQTEVRLKSGGYLVINPTEALVSVDVNSGKATKGRHIEETALKTNLEAADEVARQLKLRDLGGLVVIDFIDMEDRRSNGKVERRMKEALSQDRARVQVGRISSFGLMELSRQRLSPSLTEAQYEKCPHCNGLGLIRTADAMSLLVLRAIEEEGIRARASQIIVEVTGDVALYILNYKRRKLAEIEARYNFHVLLRVDDKIPASEYRLEVSKPAEKNAESADEEDEADGLGEGGNDSSKAIQKDDDSDKKPRKGRRGGRRRKNEQKQDDVQKDEVSDNQEKTSSGEQKVENVVSEGDGSDKKDKPKSKPRGRKKKDDTPSDSDQSKDEVKNQSEEKPKKKRSSSKTADKKVDSSDHSSDSDVAGESGSAKSGDESDGKKVPVKRAKKTTSKPKASKDKTLKDEEKVVQISGEHKKDEKPAKKDYEVVNQAPKEKKKGWWNRLVE